MNTNIQDDFQICISVPLSLLKNFCNHLKKRLQHRWFPANNAEFLRKLIFKNICERLFLSRARCFKKLQDLRSATLFKKRLWHRYFPVNFVKFLRTTFSGPCYNKMLNSSLKIIQLLPISQVSDQVILVSTNCFLLLTISLNHPIQVRK